MMLNTLHISKLIQAGLNFHHCPEPNRSSKHIFIQIELGNVDIDPFEWLLNQNNRTKLYWADREGTLEVAALGVVDQITGSSNAEIDSAIKTMHSRIKSSPHDIRYYGGISFPNKSGSQWHHFGNYHFILPRFELRKEQNRPTRLMCNIEVDSIQDVQSQIHTVSDELTRLNFSIKQRTSQNYCVLNKEDYPTYSQWTDNVNQVLRTVDFGYARKIVLARETRYELKDAPNPLLVLDKMRKLEPESFQFCFQPTPSQAFVSVTPERLYRRSGSKIFTEAIAGTCAKKLSANFTEKPEKHLLHAEKEGREHRFVSDYIIQKLHLLCRNKIECDDISLLNLNHLQHISQKFYGELIDGVTDVELLKDLHPTPAVNGYPHTKSLELINRLEPFTRGWYAGVVGWIGQDDSEFAVAIRSGLIRDRQLSVFAGAGIVQGSSPENEWAELNRKTNSFNPLSSAK